MMTIWALKMLYFYFLICFHDETLEWKGGFQSTNFNCVQKGQRWESELIKVEISSFTVQFKLSRNLSLSAEGSQLPEWNSHSPTYTYFLSLADSAKCTLNMMTI